jgi:hypothetical protein
MGTTVIVLVILAALSLIAAVIGLIKYSRLDPATRQKRKGQDPESLLDEQVIDLFRKTYIPGGMRGVLPEDSVPPEDGSFYIYDQRGHFYYRGILFRRYPGGSCDILVAPTPETPVPPKNAVPEWIICHSPALHIPGPWDETIQEALGVWELKIKSIQERLKQEELARMELRQEQDRKKAAEIEALTAAWEKSKGIHGAG